MADLRHDIVEHLSKVEERLLADDASGAIIECGAVVALALKSLFEILDDVEQLGVLIGRASKEGKLSKPVAKRLNDLNKARIAAAHPEKGLPVPELEEVAGLIDFLYDFLGEHGVLSVDDRETIRHQADQRITRRRLTDVARIDRKPQRGSLTDLMDSNRPLLVFLAHGERQQGHKFVDGFAFQLAQSRLKGGWRPETVRWPSRWQSIPSGLGHLVEQLADRMGCPLDPRLLAGEIDPEGAVWKVAIERLLDRMCRQRERFYFRHEISSPEAGDAALLEAYLRALWLPLSKRRGAWRVVVAFSVEYTRRSGTPLVSLAWRMGSAERRANDRLVAAIRASLTGGQNQDVRVLEELTSVSVSDLAEWLLNERLSHPTEVGGVARRIHAASESGRFEPVAKYVQSHFPGDEDD
jgi:hypothetical protein